MLEGLSGRDRGQGTNQNGQHQKSTQENRHLAHWASYIMSLRCSGCRDCGACRYCEPAAVCITDADSAGKYGSEHRTGARSPLNLNSARVYLCR
jgi:hypothetical protein